MENQIHLTQSRKILLLQRQLGNAGSLTSAITPYHVAGVEFVAAARSLESLHLGQSPVVKASGN